MLNVKTPTGYMLKVPAWMTDPQAEHMALTSEVALPYSTMLSALRLLADHDLTTVLGVSKPENRDASERVRIQHSTSTRQASS
jgi:hypothetical protein